MHNISLHLNYQVVKHAEFSRVIANLTSISHYTAQAIFGPEPAD